MPTIVHFEIPADDLDRAKEFYGKLFGWEIKRFPGPAEYWMVSTTDQQGEKGVDGGMMARQHPQQPITAYFDVSSIDQHVAKIEGIGGQVVVSKTAVPGFGYFAVCLDTEGNSFGIWENDADAG